MRRKVHEPSAVRSSIVLLQERFRQLQKVKEMRKKRELLKMLTVEPKHFNSNPTTRQFFYPELMIPSRSPPIVSLSPLPTLQCMLEDNKSTIETPVSKNTGSMDSTHTQSLQASWKNVYDCLINGKGPYRYNDTLVPDGIDYETIEVHPGKTYRLRVHNVGVSTSLNFRIQSHNLLLAETEGSYTVQQNYTSLDIHVGQSYSFLVTMDQNASSDYYIVASARFVNESRWQRVTGVAILRYTNSKGKAHGPLPPAPDDQFDKTYSMNQARSIRWNVSASGARPNPQGSFRYGSINVTEIYVLKNKLPEKINGKRRATVSGISFVNPSTPIRLADQYKLKGVYKLDFPSKPITGPSRAETSIINGTYRGFMEVILQNNDTKMHTYHMSGYAFFVVGMDYGDWSENSRGTYNKWDGIARTTAQVYPGAWTAILVSLDNVGVWNLRTENLDSWYLGQETYVRVVNPEVTNKTELPIPDNALFCGALSKLQKPQVIASAASSINENTLKLLFTWLIVCAWIHIFQ